MLAVSGLRDAVKKVFFAQNHFSVDLSRVLQILTCNLQITPSDFFIPIGRG